MIHFHINAPNLADWIQVILSIVTISIAGYGAYYVRKTFKEQAKINAEQLVLTQQQKELNRLSMEKDRREIRPLFTAITPVKGVVKLILENATAYGLIIKSVQEPGIDVTPNEFDYTVAPIGKAFTIRVRLHDIKLDDDFDWTDVPAVMEITYSDEVNRKYSQYLYYNGEMAWLSAPKFLETKIPLASRLGD